jgi:hypothetical protein
LIEKINNDGIEKAQEAILPFCRQKNENNISLKNLKTALRYFHDVNSIIKKILKALI